jgi:hypothetical protein
MLIALLIVIGFFVTLMFLLWLTTVFFWRTKDIAVEWLEEPAGRGEHAKGYERDLEEPGEEELEELIEPQLATSLEAVTDVLSTQKAALDSLTTDAEQSGKGKGKGDSRQAGPGGEGMNIIPRWERWQIKYQTTSRAIYAKQLDFFQIELAAAGGKPVVDYASSFTRGVRKRQAPGDKDDRLYFSWKTGKLKQFDRALLDSNGISTRNRVVLQFYPKIVENQLALLERDNAKGRHITEYKRTVFGVRNKGSGYEYYVISQDFRPRPKS